MEDEAMPLYLVVSFEKGPYCAALYEIELGSNASEGLITPLIKLFPGYNERKSSSVGAEIEGSQICLIASATRGNPSRPFKDPPRAIRIPPCVYDVETKVRKDLDVPMGAKICPTVVAAKGRGFYVLNGGPFDDFDLYPILPSFERLDSVTHAWDGYCLPNIPQVEVSGLDNLKYGRLLGYVTVNDYIVISVGQTRYPIGAKYYSYKIGGDRDSDWIPLQMQGEHLLIDERFWGKAEFVEDAIYICTPRGVLIRYGVSFDTDGSIELLHFPQTLGGQDEFVALKDSPTCFWQSSFFHLGERKFCVMRTDENLVTENGRRVEVFIAQVSESMVVTLLHRSVYELCTIGLGLEGSIGEPKLVSLLSVDRLMLQNKDLQAGNIDATKIRGEGVAASSASSGKRIRENAEPADGFLQSLGLQKYLTAFNEEEIDMAILPRITDEELKVMGLPIGARKKIRVQLHSQSIDTFLERLGLEKYSAKFKDEEIDVACLSQMSDDDLMELGLPMGPRKKILSEFKSN